MSETLTLGDPDGSLDIREQAEEKSGLGFESGPTHTVPLTVASWTSSEKGSEMSQM